MTQSALPNPNSETSGTPRRGLSRQELRDHPVVRNYMLFCLASLFLLVVCLSDRGFEWWCLVPSLIGCMTLLTNWNLGPPMVLVSVAGLLATVYPRPRWHYASWPYDQPPTLTDLLLCTSVLAYVVGHYRLLSLMRCIFPTDPRRLPGGATADPLRRRSPDLVTNWEMALVGIALPLWVGLAVMIWAWMLRRSMSGELMPLAIPIPLWRALQIVWASLAVLGVTGIVASYRRWTTATPEESLLFLQDQCWRHTRREQSNLNRWLTWARLRAQRKKETL